MLAHRRFTGSFGVTVGNVQRPATVSFGLRASQLSSPPSSPARRSSSHRQRSTPSARTRSATWRLGRGSRVLEADVEYLSLNFAALWKKQTALPSLLAYAGIPYQVFGDRAGALD